MQQESCANFAPSITTALTLGRQIPGSVPWGHWNSSKERTAHPNWAVSITIPEASPIVTAETERALRFRSFLRQALLLKTLKLLRLPTTWRGAGFVAWSSPKTVQEVVRSCPIPR